MSDILSQEEIDKLLQAMANGEEQIIDKTSVEQKRFSSYDFARPSKFNKEQLRTLEVIFESFSRMASSFFTGYLRTSTTIDVLGSEQVTYGEFNNSLLNPVVLGIIDFSPFKGNILVDLSPVVGYSMLDRIMGGVGEPISNKRDFTEIEVILLTRIMRELVGILKDPWSQVCDVNPSLEKIETNSQFAQVMSPNEMIALITLTVKIGDIEGLLNFCIPHIVIEPIAGSLNTKHWFESTGKDTDGKYRPSVEKQVEEAYLSVSVIVGKTHITVNEFINIQVGDVIPLDSYVTSDFKVNVGDIAKFYAKPGINRGKNAIQITSIIGKEE